MLSLKTFAINWLKQTFVWMVSQSNHQKQDWLPCLLSIRCQFWIWYWGLVSKSKWVFSYLKRTLTSMSNPFRKQGLSKFSSSSIIRRWQEQCNLSMMQFCIQSCIHRIILELFISKPIHFLPHPMHNFSSIVFMRINQPCLKSFSEMNITKYNKYYKIQ